MNALGIAGGVVTLLGLLRYALSVTPSDFAVARVVYVGGLVMVAIGVLTR